MDMLEGSSDWKGRGHSLGYYLSTELELWMKEHPAVQQVREAEPERRQGGEGNRFERPSSVPGFTRGKV